MKVVETRVAEHSIKAVGMMFHATKNMLRTSCKVLKTASCMGQSQHVHQEGHPSDATLAGQHFVQFIHHAASALQTMLLT